MNILVSQCEHILAGLVRWNVRDHQWMSVAWILEEHGHRRGCGPDKVGAWTIGMAERRSAEWTKNAGGHMGGGGQMHAWGARGHVTVCEARGLSLDVDRSEDERRAGAVDGRHGMDGWPGRYLWQG